MADVDAIVIGAGYNGLVAANLLADAGWSVVVLEAAPEPGGALRSADLAAPGFRTDVCASFVPFAAASPLLLRLGLADYGVQWRRAPRVLTHLLPDGRAASLSPDPATTAASVETFAAGDGERWLDLYREWEQFGPAVMQALFTPFPPVAAVGHLAGRLSVARALRLVRQGMLPARRFGNELFDGEGAKALLAGCSIHTDLGPDDAGGGVFGWLLVMLGQQVGFPTVAGGVGGLTDALVARLRDRGGEVVCSAPVERVLVRGSRAVGARTTVGEEWRARRAVIADVSAPALYGGLVEARHLPSRLLADLEHFAWDHATLKVDWAVDGAVPWTSPEAREAGVVHLGGDVDGLARYAGRLANRETPEDPFLIVGQLTTTDSSRSPEGTETLWAYTHLPHEAGRPHDFEAIAAHVERMEHQIERYAPGFRTQIRDRFVHDPADMERGNPNLFGGAINGGSAALHQQLVFRPTPGLGRADTPLDRLYLASSSAHPSGGVHGGPGANAARAALARSHRAAGWLYGAGVRAANRLVFGRS